MPFLRNTPILRYALITLFSSLVWMYMSITNSANGSTFVMPNLAEMIRLALEFGDIEAVVGQRHYTGAPVLQWDQHFSVSHETPVFHAYGFGGSGLTLAPSVAEYIASQVGEQVLSDHSPITDSSGIVILGAGYIGIFTALEIRRFFNRNNKPHIPVRVVAQAYPKGITEIMSDKSEPTRADNYSSMTAGGWVMPVSIEPLANKTLWCSLVQRAQELWLNSSQTPPLNIATHVTQSLVFYDQTSNKTVMEDKSGIRVVNEVCPLNLYPEHPFQGSFYSLSYSGSAISPLHFDQVVAFDNVIQTDTISVLQHMTKRLSEEGVELVQTEALMDSFEQLSQHFNTGSKTIVINASGHGACSIFGCKPSSPIRGDLVLLKIPTEQLTEQMKEISRYGFWSGGSNYVFLRYTLDGQWMEVVLGGSFIKGDHDLSIRPKTIHRIVSFWLDFFHKGPENKGDSIQKDALIKSVLKRALPQH